MIANYRVTMSLTLLVSLLLFGVGNADDEPAKTKIERNDKLDGTWDDEGKICVITKNEITIYYSTSQPPTKIKITIDSTTKPKQIDFDEKGSAGLGIYEVVGDTMKYCVGMPPSRGKGIPRPAATRPTEFKQVPGETVLRTLKRREPAAGTAVKIQETYLENEALADVNYTGRMVTVTGTVQRIQRGEGGYVVAFSPKPVHLLFSFDYATRNRLAKLNKGNEVTIEALCLGKRFVKGDSGEEAIFFAGGKIIEAKK